MIFPRGFTGIFDAESRPVPEVDRGKFKAVCFAAARELDGRVLGFSFADVTPNFHRATVEWGHGSQRVSVLCNRHYWIIDFCEPSETFPLDYLDAPELTEVLRSLSDWQILTKAELEIVVDDSALALMDFADRRVIEMARRKSWFTPARTVGDVLFHCWD